MSLSRGQISFNTNSRKLPNRPDRRNHRRHCFSEFWICAAFRSLQPCPNWRSFDGSAFSPPPRATFLSLALPAPAGGNWPCVRRYLVDQRKLLEKLLEPLTQSGVHYADARANAVFVLLDATAAPVGAELRGTTGSGWRGMAPGSRKDRGSSSSFEVSIVVNATGLCGQASSCWLSTIVPTSPGMTGRESASRIPPTAPRI